MVVVPGRRWGQVYRGRPAGHARSSWNPAPTVAEPRGPPRASGGGPNDALCNTSRRSLLQVTTLRFRSYPSPICPIGQDKKLRFHAGFRGRFPHYPPFFPALPPALFGGGSRELESVPHAATAVPYRRALVESVRVSPDGGRARARAPAKADFDAPTWTGRANLPGSARPRRAYPFGQGGFERICYTIRRSP